MASEMGIAEMREAAARIANREKERQEAEGEGGGREWATASLIAGLIRALPVAALATRPSTASEVEARRDKVAGMIALAGLGTTTGEARKPPGEWRPDEFESRIMDIIPTHVVDRIYVLTDAILAALSGQESRS